MTITHTSEGNLPKLKSILVIGSGGRENALAWSLRDSFGIEKVFVSPGNAGTQSLSGCDQLNIESNDEIALKQICKSNKIDLVVIGPEEPLSNGLADSLRKEGLAVFGPGADGAKIEASKSWAKSMMEEDQIPTAKHWSIDSEEEAIEILHKVNKPLVVKADGLAAGKGVTVAETIEQTREAIGEVFKGKFGSSGEQVVLEERIYGPEISIFALCDGKKMVLLPTAQDHKRLKEGDMGPNTGGMGSYCPAPLVNQKDLKAIKKSILEPTLDGLIKRGIDYRGVIYAGLMLTESGPNVIEFNCRFGDPECQAIMPLLGKEFARVIQACALGALEKAPQLSISSLSSACVVAAAAGYPEEPRKNDPINIDIKASKSLQIFHAGTKCNDKGEIVTSGGRVLSVVAQESNFDLAFSKAYKALEKISFDGINYRKDIGHQVRSY